MGKSTDYKKLYELICSGEAVPAFVDHLYNKDKSDLCRDVCQVVRRGEFDINIFARGIGYGAIYPFDAEHGSEFELFAALCAGLNLEFYE